MSILDMQMLPSHRISQKWLIFHPISVSSQNSACKSSLLSESQKKVDSVAYHILIDRKVAILSHHKMHSPQETQQNSSSGREQQMQPFCLLLFMRHSELKRVTQHCPVCLCQSPRKENFSFTRSSARCLSSPTRSASFRFVMCFLLSHLPLTWEPSDVSAAAVSNSKASLSCLGNGQGLGSWRTLHVHKGKQVRVQKSQDNTHHQFMSWNTIYILNKAQLL